MKSTHDLISEIEGFIGRYLALPRNTILPIAAWTFATHFAEEFDVFPYLAVTSPLKQSGKTRLLESIELLASHPLRSVGFTEASLFRSIKSSKTMLIDEAETLSGPSERAQLLKSVLNAGYRHGGNVTRCVGEKNTPTQFDVYCPKAIAAIGELPETIADRSIRIAMRRRKPTEKVERFLFAKAKKEAKPIREAIDNFCQSHKADVAKAYRDCADLAFLSDRDAELWMPLFAIVRVADAEHLGELEAAAKSLSAVKADADQEGNHDLRLLADIRGVWPDGQPYAFSNRLLADLKELKESPWSDNFLSPRQMAGMLRKYGISSRTVRIGAETGKGYVAEELQDASDRYLARTSVTRHNQTRALPSVYAGCDTVTDNRY